MPKIVMVFKDPDVTYEAIEDAAGRSVREMSGLSASEAADLAETRKVAFGEACSPWLRYGEYVGIEIDTDAGTARVLKTNEWK